jgi:Lrp/AsnC family transcriptional regulator, leucine-responsive regulatory protein
MQVSGVTDRAIRGKSRSQTFEPIDELDRSILQAIQADPRIRVTELSRAVGLSAPATGDRLRRLEEQGVVSYRAVVDPRALGYGISAIVRVSPHGRDLTVIPQIARDVPEVTECYRITGEDSYFMRLYLKEMADLEVILDRFAPHGRTTTSIVHSAQVGPRALPVLEPGSGPL